MVSGYTKRYYLQIIILLGKRLDAKDIGLLLYCPCRALIGLFVNPKAIPLGYPDNYREYMALATPIFNSAKRMNDNLRRQRCRIIIEK
jgi:hypothetical protein